MIKRLIRIVADIDHVEDASKYLLGQAGEGVGIFEVCDLIPAEANCASMRQNQMCGFSSS
jgi:hypothetical protein